MKKVLSVIIFLLISLIFNMNNISASKAICTYDSSMGTIPTYTFTYEYDKPLRLSPQVEKLTVRYEDFIDKNYNIVCPKLYIYIESRLVKINMKLLLNWQQMLKAQILTNNIL